MSSTTRYAKEYLQSPPHPGVLARRRAWRTAVRNRRIAVAVFAVGVIGFCAALGYGVVSMVTGAGR